MNRTISNLTNAKLQTLHPALTKGKKQEPPKGTRSLSSRCQTPEAASAPGQGLQLPGLWDTEQQVWSIKHRSCAGWGGSATDPMGCSINH